MSDIVINPQTGERKRWDGSKWADLPSVNAPGASALMETFTPGDKSEAAYFRQYRDKDNPAVAGARTALVNARRMEGLIAKQKAQGQGTGGIYGVPVLGGVAGWLDPEIREMDAIQAETARSKRQPGEGAISDFDAQQFMVMTYGRDKPLQTNQNLVRASRIAADSALQRRQFMEWHYGTYGNMTGAEEAWDRYAQDNPIFDPQTERTGVPSLNGKRQNWRQYFGVVRSEGDRRPTQGQVDTERAAGVTKAPANNKPTDAVRSEIERMRKSGQWDDSKPFGTIKRPFVATNPSVAARLPKGTYYIDANGDLYRQD